MQGMPGYIAAVLDRQTAEALRRLARHPTVHCHHITMAFRPDHQTFSRYADMIGKSVEFEIVGVSHDDKGQAALVGGLMTEKVAHVTISCAEGVAPAYSNELIAKETAAPFAMRGSAIVQFVRF